MPYIKEEQRKILDPKVEDLSDFITNGGKINYCIVKLCLSFVQFEGENYENYAECLAAIEGAKQELYRKHIAPYEDKKEQENGPIKV